MKDMALYIENVFKNVPYNDVLLQFERELLEAWEEMRARVMKAGLTDENVAFDLFLSGHPELPAEYAAYRKAVLKKRREKRRHRFFIIGTPIYYLLMVAVYLGELCNAQLAGKLAHHHRLRYGLGGYRGPFAGV